MDLGISGKTAIVAASSKGIGLACATALAREGVKIGMCSRNQDEVRDAADFIRHLTGQDVFAMKADLNNPEQIQNFYGAVSAELGEPDILVNNCGGPRPGTFEELDEEAWANGYDSTLMSAVRLIRFALPVMKARRWGRIINITSLSVRQPVDGLILSNAFRAGVVGMAKTLSREVGPFGITVNTVGPGFTATQRLDQLMKKRAENANCSQSDIEAGVQSEIPLRRFADSEEIADCVAFLASKRAAYITGTIIPVDGGFIKGL